MIETAWLMLRVLGYLLVLQSAGCVMFGALFAQTFAPGVIHLNAFTQRLALGALGILIAQTLLEPVHLGGAWDAMSDPALWTFFAHSSSAMAFALRAVGVSLLLLSARAQAAHLLGLLGVALTVGSFLLTGHTVSSLARAPAAACLFVHLTSVAFWLGALWPLLQLLQRAPATMAVEVLRRFSQLAVWIVPVIGVAGIALAMLLLPSLAALRQPYGWLLLSKGSVFAILLGLGALNRSRWMPALARGESGVAQSLRRCISLEWLLIAAVLALTAVMTGEFSPHGD